MFDDIDGQERAGQSPTGKPSPRQEYMSLAAVPRFSRPSMELQVSTDSATSTAAALCYGLWWAGLDGGGFTAPGL